MTYEYTLVLSLLGFLIAYYIWHTKTNKKQLVCIHGKECNKVIESEHSEHFGAENSVLGMIYYVVIIITSLVAIFYPALLNFSLFTIGFLILTGAAAVFSIYLVFVQALVIKHFCEYCFASTAIVIVIFLILLI